VVHFCLDGNSCAGLKDLCPSPGIKYYADGNSCAPKHSSVIVYRNSSLRTPFSLRLLCEILFSARNYIHYFRLWRSNECNVDSLKSLNFI
jgi:hypothetical protein